MARVASLVTLVLLGSSGCRVLGQDDLTAWKRDHGIADTWTGADTGLPLDPPDELCSEPWGRLNTSMDVDEQLRTVQAGSQMVLGFWFTGPVDICAMGCDVDWVQEPYLTTSKNYTDEDFWVDVPARLIDEDNLVYAMLHVLPPKDTTPGEQGECWVETSAGTRSAPIGIMKI